MWLALPSAAVTSIKPAQEYVPSYIAPTLGSGTESGGNAGSAGNQDFQGLDLLKAVEGETIGGKGEKATVKSILEGKLVEEKMISQGCQIRMETHAVS